MQEALYHNSMQEALYLIPHDPILKPDIPYH